MALSPTAYTLRGYGRAGTQNDRRSRELSRLNACLYACAHARLVITRPGENIDSHDYYVAITIRVINSYYIPRREYCVHLRACWSIGACGNVMPAWRMGMAMQYIRTDMCAYASKRKHVNARYYDDDDLDGESRADVDGESHTDVDGESHTDVDGESHTDVDGESRR